MESKSIDDNPYEPTPSRSRWRHSPLFVLMETSLVLVLLAALAFAYWPAKAPRKKEYLHRAPPPIRERLPEEEDRVIINRWPPKQELQNHTLPAVPNSEHLTLPTSEPPQP